MDHIELDGFTSVPPEHHSATTRTPKPSAETSSKVLFIVIGSLYLGTFLVALDTTIIGTAIPAITTEFQALDEIAWYGSGYLLTLTALQPALGKLYKVLNTKLLYLVSIAIFEAGSILCAASPSSPVFIVGRAVAGCGAAGIMQGSYAIVTKTVPLSKRPFYFGLFVSAFGLTIGIGPVMGGAFADRGIWRWCFWINLPLGAMVMLMVTVFLKLKSVDAARETSNLSAKQVFFRLDPGGSALIIACAVCLLMAMQWGGQSLPWSSPTIISLLAAFVFLLLLFLVVEWRMGNDAAVPFRILRQRSIAFGAVYLFLFSMPNFSYGMYVPIFFQAAKGFSALRSGIEILSLALTQIAVVVMTGTLVSKYGYYTPFIIGGTAVSVIGSGLITLMDLETPHASWVGYFLICGIGTGAAINLPYTAVSTVLVEVDMVTGNAIMQFAFQLGGAVSLCISQAIFLNRLTSDVKASLPGVSVAEVVHAGAYNIPAMAPSSVTLHMLRVSYRNSTRDVFMYLLVATGLALFASFGFEHMNVKEVEEERKG
ncbi:major facilitator superfamily-domain-containing protein [Lophiotrema nucula]|uniref:Major facilitator superfamily-domain-containing protein n=1 Tax=Lophiotrema nucula TaxID=690887 RepID=A0A6A5ZKK3_9PLEO|nr:major facilitator superfamily-domain-containing protein [Lophiotrema nucula]